MVLDNDRVQELLVKEALHIQITPSVEHFNMIHEIGKNVLILEQTGTRVPEWKSGGNAICCWDIVVLE